jgi:ribonucleoside-diphosphate reductase alpha chain
MQKVIWERGPVRLGTHQKTDGTAVLMWHDSEVAAIAYAIQMIIESRTLATPHHPSMKQTADNQLVSHAMSGKKCGECGAHAVIKKDGCEFCTQCGYTGSCG